MCSERISHEILVDHCSSSNHGDGRADRRGFPVESETEACIVMHSRAYGGRSDGQLNCSWIKWNEFVGNCGRDNPCSSRCG